MKDRFFRGLNKVKSKFIFAMILWVVISLLFISPLTVSMVETLKEGDFNIAVFIPKLGEAISNFFQSIGKAFSAGYIGTYWSIFWKFSIFYMVVMVIGLVRAIPNGEYGDIEHGSSDWSSGGEQYSTLNSRKGIILAEKNYLPVDKRGNVNVLVVGRFRIW